MLFCRTLVQQVFWVMARDARRHSKRHLPPFYGGKWALTFQILLVCHTNLYSLPEERFL